MAFYINGNLAVDNSRNFVAPPGTQENGGQINSFGPFTNKLSSEIPFSLNGLTTVTYTVPSWSNYFVLSFYRLSLNSAGDMCIRLGRPDGTIINSGYVSTSQSKASTESNATLQFQVRLNNANRDADGQVTLIRESATGLNWIQTHNLRLDGALTISGAGSLAMTTSGDVGRIQLFTTQGSFDAGFVRIRYFGDPTP